MQSQRIHHLLKEKKNIQLEFKEAENSLPENLFETICSMLNRSGGDILLGVTDKGDLSGVAADKVDKMIKDLVNLSNNQQKLNPPHILFPVAYKINGKHLIHVEVPSSSQVHKTGRSIYDRSNDGDFKIEHPHQIAGLFNRKNKFYSECTIYPALRFEDFDQSLFPKVRNLIRSNQFDHPWLQLSDRSILEVAGLWRKDQMAGEEGYTLAAALLFGKDVVIQSILPYYKIDALVRIENFNRYDDRAYIQTNLIDSFEHLMKFVGKHLPDPFYMEGDQRVSLRTKIFREIAANLIIHREYMNPAPSIFTIFMDRVEVQNANIPNGEGPIDPNNFAPFTKNPLIAKFFKQIGHVDELGSGVLNTTRLIKNYSGNVEPKFIEGPVFRTIIPLKINKRMISKVDGVVNGAVNGAVKEVLNTNVSKGTFGSISNSVKSKITSIVSVLLELEGIRRPDLGKMLNIPQTSIERYLKIAKSAMILEYKGPAKTGGYYITKFMKEKINEFS